MNRVEHRYIDRATGNVVREHLLADAVIGALYPPALENAPWLTRLASSRYVSRALGYLNYDNLLSSRATGMLRFLRQSGIQLSEFVGNLSEYDTPRKIFERQIRYWNCRPMPANPRAVLCPADARALLGSMKESSGLFLKKKFSRFPSCWARALPGSAPSPAESMPSFALRPRNITTRTARFRAACSTPTRLPAATTRAIPMRPSSCLPLFRRTAEW
jgi:hypothetical protein